MDGFTVYSSISSEDWQAYVRAIALRSVPSRRRSVFPGLIVTSLLVGGGAAWWVGSGHELLFPSVLVGFLIVAIQSATSTFFARRGVVPSENGAFLGPREFVISERGLQVRRSGSETMVEWQAVQDFARTPYHLFIWTDRLAAYLIPVRDLPPHHSADEVAAQIRQWIHSAKRVNQAQDHGEVLDDIRNDKAADVHTTAVLLRLSILRPVSNLTLRTLEWKIAAAAALALSEFAVLDRLATGPGAQLSIFGIPGIAAYVLAGLALAWILSRLSQPSIPYKDALLLVLGWGVIAIGASTLIEEYVPYRLQYFGRLVLLLYSVAYFRVALKSIVGTVQPAALLAAGLWLAGFYWISSKTYLGPTLWAVPDDDSVAAYTKTARRAEELLFAQPAAVDAQLSHIAAASGLSPKVYFVGFAGVGEQKVFAEEIHLAQQEIDNRYGTTDRSAILINDVRDLDHVPLATVSGLRRTLVGIANKMDVSRDVLFLALSSHGSASPELSVSNGSLPLSGLSGEQLEQALADSGIKWKVIVISACHAGAFIPALKDDHTIVIAAAAADRTSFGCSNDRDLTYFGEAFYRDALPQAKSLREAFETAKASIAQRERAEKLDPSSPTAFYGAATEEKMAEIDAKRSNDGK